ncbi:MAG: hypothetical protein ACKVVT_00565 [Dehalococcoidia bacterium]
MTDRPARVSVVRAWALWGAGAFLLVWGLTIGWWAILEPAVANKETEIVVPAGTAARIAAGEPVFLPSVYSIRSGGVLVVVNRDVVEHVVGPATIPPGATARIENQAGADALTCTIHPSGSIDLALQPRPAFWRTLLPAVAAGLPLGLLAAGVSELTRRLG